MKYLTKVLKYSTTNFYIRWEMAQNSLINEGQLSHKYTIASPVEPMNLLSKGSNESLPKY